MARLMDSTFEMLVMAQYNIPRHGGVENIQVSIAAISCLNICKLLSLKYVVIGNNGNNG